MEGRWNLAWKSCTEGEGFGNVASGADLGVRVDLPLAIGRAAGLGVAPSTRNIDNLSQAEAAIQEYITSAGL
jgi:hypothetical protein